MRAATLWRRVLAVEFVSAAGIAVYSWKLGLLPGSFVLPAAIAGLILIQGLLVAASLIAGRALGGARTAWARVFATALVIARETLHFACAQVAMSVWPGARARNPDTRRRASHAPVLLVHGLACNGGVWWMLGRRLRDAGFTCVHSVDLEPLDADIDQLASALAQQVARLQQAYRGERLTIIAHSMGGLVVRAMLGLPGTGPIHHLITVATPHGGAGLARVLDWPCVRQMRANSEWLSRLNARTVESRTGPLTTCFYSNDDNLVAPATSATLPGAALVEVSGLGHFGLLTSARAGNLLISTLREVA